MHDADRLSSDSTSYWPGKEDDERRDICWLRDAQVGLLLRSGEEPGAEAARRDALAGCGARDQRGRYHINSDAVAFCFQGGSSGEHHDPAMAPPMEVSPDVAILAASEETRITAPVPRRYMCGSARRVSSIGVSSNP